MVKKLKKYVKFVVCCVLMLSLMAPSYAALSASDGSAFVTKAEFDSALADFNARLTTFEAGINSKIDSQVTSYLDRNGIWSGKEQVIDDVSGWANVLKYGNLWSDICGWGENICKNEANKPTKYWNFNVVNKIIVNEINKTGLAYLVVAGTHSANYIAQNVNNAWPLMEGGMKSLLLFSTERKGTKSERTTINIFSISNGSYVDSSNGNPKGWFNVSIDTDLTVALFFVDRGDTLYGTWRLAYNGSVSTAYQAGIFNQSSGLSYEGVYTGYPSANASYKDKPIGFRYSVDVY